MLEVLLIITFAGLMLASHRRMGIGNPFQIYFLVWFILVLGYYVSRETYISVSFEFVGLLLVANFFSFVLLFIVYTERKVAVNLKTVSINNSQDWLIILAQIAVTVALPFVYLQAVTLAQGEDIFTVLGYIKLRSAMVREGADYGLLRYFFILSFVVSSLTMFSYRQRSAHLGRLVLSILVSLSYAYLSTGRTFILLFMCLMTIPLIFVGAIRLRGILISVLITAILFMFVAGMTLRGISINMGLSENIHFFSENIRSYTIAPIVAFLNFVASEPVLDWGENTFRFLIALQYTLGLSDTAPLQLIRDYALVPDATNVYTVYEPYFRDFSYFGILIPPFFLIIHYWLYRKAIRFGGVWLFYYSAAVYPLLMQFFQDQYFSLFSMWIQFVFWYWLFIELLKSRSSIDELRHA